MKSDLFIGQGDGVNFEGPYTIVEIDEKVRDDDLVREKLFRKIMEPGAGFHLERAHYERIPRFTVEFDPSIDTLIEARRNRLSTVFAGPNNSGKSLILKQILATLGYRTCILTCNRFSAIDVINTQSSHGFDERRQHYDSVVNQLEAGHFHDDQNPRQLEQLIRSLTDAQQDRLFELAGQLLGAKIQMLQTDSNRSRTSPWYVDIDGHSLKYSSSGTRLLFTLLGHLFDDYYQAALIDEPELGLSPRIQAVLAKTLYDQSVREKYFPHLKQVFVVTHSHLFLDRKVLANNHSVSKDGNLVSVKPLESVAELHELQFGMLGNDLDHLYMPAAIVVVEGPCDISFIKRLLALRCPNYRIAIVVARGDGGIPDKIQTLSDGFGSLHTSPYRSRLFAVLDERHSMKRSALTRQGVPEENIHVWTKNGIEWYYPKTHVAAAFMCTESDLSGIDLGTEKITVGSITHSKIELANLVVQQLSLTDLLDLELESFLKNIERATSR